MKIVVLVKEVPDTYGDRKLNLETGLAERSASAAVLDEINERAVEAALTLAEHHPGAEVVALSMGPASAAASVRKALAMGANTAMLVADEELIGADHALTAQVLAAASTKIGYDLIIAGCQSTDGAGGVVPSMLAELLGIDGVTGLSSFEMSDGVLTGKRPVEGGVQTVSVTTPAIISITEALPDARFPNFKGIMAAKKKPFETLSLLDLEIAPEDSTYSRSIVIGISEKPPRTAGVKIIDEGDAGEQLAEFLAQNQLA